MILLNHANQLQDPETSIDCAKDSRWSWNRVLRGRIWIKGCEQRFTVTQILRKRSEAPKSDSAGHITLDLTLARSRENIRHFEITP